MLEMSFPVNHVTGANPVFPTDHLHCVTSKQNETATKKVERINLNSLKQLLTCKIRLGLVTTFKHRWAAIFSLPRVLNINFKKIKNENRNLLYNCVVKRQSEKVNMHSSLVELECIKHAHLAFSAYATF